MHRLILTLLCLVSLLLLGGCRSGSGTRETGFVGHWRCESGIGQMAINADGTFSEVEAGTRSLRGTWTAQGAELRLTAEGSPLPGQYRVRLADGGRIAVLESAAPGEPAVRFRRSEPARRPVTAAERRRWRRLLR